ncbi:hypothetical protein JCM3765_007479 [Sporobolomyces pararoseus]
MLRRSLRRHVNLKRLPTAPLLLYKPFHSSPTPRLFGLKLPTPSNEPLAVAPRSFWNSTRSTPTESSVLADYRSALEFAYDRYGPSAKYVLYGHSLGGAASILLLDQLSVPPFPSAQSQIETTTSALVPSPAGLILENPLPSIPYMVKALYPQKWLPYHYLGFAAFDRWDAIGRLRNLASTTRRMEGESKQAISLDYSISTTMEALANHIYHGPIANIDVTSHKLVWVITFIMGISSVALYFLGLRRPAGQRAFHELAAAICFTACMSYFAMATGYGSYPVPVEYIRNGYLGKKWVKAGVTHPTRSIYYARYIDWTITTPLLLLELALATGLPLPKIFNLIYLDLAMIITGLIGALITSGYKWVWFGFGCFALVGIWKILLIDAKSAVGRLGTDYSKAFTTSAIILSGLWLVYPVVFSISEASNLVHPNTEAALYGVLDVLAKPVYCFIHVIAIEKLDWSRLGWTSGKRDAAGASLLGGNRDANYGATDSARGN